MKGEASAFRRGSLPLKTDQDNRPFTGDGRSRRNNYAIHDHFRIDRIHLCRNVCLTESDRRAAAFHHLGFVKNRGSPS